MSILTGILVLLVADVSPGSGCATDDFTVIPVFKFKPQFTQMMASCPTATRQEGQVRLGTLASSVWTCVTVLQLGHLNPSPLIDEERLKLPLQLGHSKCDVVPGIRVNAPQSGQLICVPAPESSTTRHFSHALHLKKISAIF